MIVVEILVQEIIVSVISLYASQRGLHDSQKDEENQLLFLSGDFNGLVKSNPEDYGDPHGGYGCGVSS